MPGKTEVHDEQMRKLFVGGISAGTTERVLKDFYSQWGDIEDVVVMRDASTGRSRGFGFVTYASQQQLDAAMAARPHVVDGKEVEPKRAMPRELSIKPETHVSVNKIYVSGLREEHTEQMLHDYFAQFGNVSRVEIKVDQYTGKKRGFAFVTFDDYDPVDQVILVRSHIINGRRCDVKKALSKEAMRKVQQGEIDRQHREMRSRGPSRMSDRYGDYCGSYGGGYDGFDDDLGRSGGGYIGSSYDGGSGYYGYPSSDRTIRGGGYGSSSRDDWMQGGGGNDYGDSWPQGWQDHSWNRQERSMQRNIPPWKKMPPSSFGGPSMHPQGWRQRWSPSMNSYGDDGGYSSYCGRS